MRRGKLYAAHYDQVNAISLIEVVEEPRTTEQPEKRNADNPLRLMQWLLYAIAILSFTWPAYRAFLNVEIENNEGWNAYFADAAMGKMPLYPSAGELITNNYPPLSFYMVGLVGRLVGDPVLAGRLLSLAAVIAIATAIGLSVRHLGGTGVAATISAAFFVAMMSRFFMSYVGMNDPQLFSEAIMAFGFLGFLVARSKDRGFAMPILIMALAGFVKHNIIAMPLTAFMWLALNRRREAIKCMCVAAIAIITGIAICYGLYGRDFFFNLLSPRHYSVKRALHSFADLQWVSVGLIACICNGWARWRDPNVRFCSGFIAIALGSFFLQRSGDGVDLNAQFDLVIAVAMGLGLAYTHISLLLAVCVRLLASEQLQPLRLVVDGSFRNEIRLRGQAMAASVERVRKTPGDVMCPLLISYRAGKPFAVDKFNVQERISSGSLPNDAVTARVAAGTLTILDIDHRALWSEEQKHFDSSPIATMLLPAQSNTP
jgi:hypothetical protein